MMTDNIEARRLAAQREDDLSNITDREAHRETQRVERAQKVDEHTSRQDEHLGVIQVMIDQLAQDMKRLKQEMGDLEETCAEFIAIAQRLADRSITTRTFVWCMGSLLVLMTILIGVWR